MAYAMRDMSKRNKVPFITKMRSKLKALKANAMSSSGLAAKRKRRSKNLTAVHRSRGNDKKRPSISIY